MAQALGTNRETLRQDQFIADNATLLDPADFADWDEGKLSTNKAFQRIKAAQKQAEQERDSASARVATLQSDLADALKEIDALERQNDQLYEKANAKPEAQVVTREVESDSAKRRIRELEHLEQVHSSDNQKLRRKLEEARRELEKAKLLIGEKQRNDSAEWDIAALTTATNNYLRQYGGKAWAFDQFYRVDETTQSEFVKAINNLAAFAQNLAQMIKEQTNE